MHAPKAAFLCWVLLLVACKAVEIRRIPEVTSKKYDVSGLVL